MEQLKLNMIPNGVNPVFHASQYDKGRQIRFVLDETLSGAEVTTSYRAKDGTEYGNVQMSVSGNAITDTIPEEVLTDYGMIEGEVDIDGIGSLNFFVEVEKDAYDGGVITTQTATGAIATFETNIETAFVSLKSDINPVQDLHGYSKPWSGGGGKNKAHVTATSQTISGVAYTVATDGRVKANGTASGTSTLDLGTITLIGGTTYTLSGCPSGGSGLTYALFLRGSGSFTQKLDFGGGISFTVTDTVTTTLSMIVYNGYTINNLTFEPMVRLSSTSADYEPYSNICPISGFSGANIVRCGKNLANIRPYSEWSVIGSYLCYQNALPKDQNFYMSFADNDTSVDVSGCYFGFLDDEYLGGSITGHFKWILNNGTYTANNNLISGPKLLNGFVLYPTTEATYNKILARYKIQVELGNQATAYKPYNGTTTAISFGQTVYGGVADVTNGKLTVTHKLVTYNGSENWQFLNPSYYIASPTDCRKSQTVIANQYNGVAPTYYNVMVNGNIALSTVLDNLLVRNDSIASVADFKTALSNNPLTVLYELATPIEITTTPENLTAISGENNVYGDTNGDTEVKYYIEV